MVAHGWRVLGGIHVRFNSSRPRVRLNTSRSRGSYALAVIGGCLGVYAVLAVAFHWLVEPTLAKNQGVAAYEPAPVRIVQSPALPVVPAVRSEPPSRVASKPGTSATTAAAARESKETTRPEPASRVAAKPPTAAPVTAAPVTAAPATAAPVTAAAPQLTETARSEPPSRAAPQPPASTPVTAAAPQSTETLRSEPASGVASEPPASATVAAAAPESTETAATEPKKTTKKKVARTTARQREARDWNPFKFFAWQPSYGARRSF